MRQDAEHKPSTLLNLIGVMAILTLKIVISVIYVSALLLQNCLRYLIS